MVTGSNEHKLALAFTEMSDGGTNDIFSRICSILEWKNFAKISGKITGSESGIVEASARLVPVISSIIPNRCLVSALAMRLR